MALLVLANSSVGSQRVGSISDAHRMGEDGRCERLEHRAEGGSPRPPD